jgi:hypothetical protein
MPGEIVDTKVDLRTDGQELANAVAQVFMDQWKSEVGYSYGKPVYRFSS